MSWIRQAVILAGGRGARLGSLTDATPKPLLDVAGRPFLAFLIDWLVRHGIDDVLISAGYRAEAIGAFVSEHQWLGPADETVRVRVVIEDEPAGTAGALKYVAPYLAEKSIVLNGDTWFDCPLLDVLNAGRVIEQGNALIGLRRLDDTGRFGRVSVDGERVVAFAEKAGPGPGLINSGLYVLTREVVEEIAQLPCSLEHDVFPRLVDRECLRGIELDGFFIDIGIPETYALVQTELPRQIRRPAAFFDRDGVLNVDKGYVHSPSQFEWIEAAAGAVKCARERGYFAVVVTNQAGVARGFYSEDDVRALHRWINDALRFQGTQIDAFLYCPYHTEGVVEQYRCDHPERKPAPGMILRAAAQLPIDLSRSFLVGDKASDLAAASAAGIGGHLFEGGNLEQFVGEIISKMPDASYVGSSAPRKEVGR